jgi:hypothetical protein
MVRKSQRDCMAQSEKPPNHKGLKKIAGSHLEPGPYRLIYSRRRR